MVTRTFLPLMQREWLQYRFGWMLLAAIPLGLALLTVSVAQFDFDEGIVAKPQSLALLLSAMPALIGPVLMLWVAVVTGVINIAGLARRDHADRSNEFWLSLPVPHSAALGTPMLVHLVLLPAVAAVVGWLAGQFLAVLLVGRLVGASALAEVQWSATLAATATLTVRFLAGLPLAVLWALPVVLLVTLLNAWFRRWGWVVLAVGVGLITLFDQIAFGQRRLLDVLRQIFGRAGQAFMGAGGVGLDISPDSGLDALARFPAIAVRDFGAAVSALASPLFLGGVLFSAGCFALLVRWRQNSSGRAD